MLRLIFYTTNRKTIILGVIGAVQRGLEAAQIPIPSIRNIVLRRTPPTAVTANIAEITIAEAITAQKS